MFAEIRVSWMLLFLLTLSAADKQYAETGRVSSSMGIMILAVRFFFFHSWAPSAV